MTKYFAESKKNKQNWIKQETLISALASVLTAIVKN